MTAWRRYAVVFALAAMILRAVVPTGWMPGAQVLSGGVPIVVCTLTGEKHIVLDAGGQPVPSDRQHESGGDQAPCAFAAVASLAPPVAAVAFIPILIESPPAASAARIEVPRPAPKTAWQSRAPPRELSAV